MPAAIPLAPPLYCEYLGCKAVATHKVVTEKGRTQLVCKKHIPQGTIIPKVTNERQDLGKVRLKSTIPSNTEGDVIEVLRQLTAAEVRERQAAREKKVAKKDEEATRISRNLVNIINAERRGERPKEKKPRFFKPKTPKQKKPTYNFKEGEAPDISRLEKPLNRGVSVGKPDHYFRVYVTYPDSLGRQHRHEREYIEVLPSDKRKAKKLLYERLKSFAPTFAELWHNCGSPIEIEEIKVPKERKKRYIGLPSGQEYYIDRLTKK